MLAGNQKLSLLLEIKGTMRRIINSIVAENKVIKYITFLLMHHHQITNNNHHLYYHNILNYRKYNFRLNFLKRLTIRALRTEETTNLSLEVTIVKFQTTGMK